MKKFFTLIAATFVAVCASAQVISFSETAAKGSLDGKTFGGDGFVLTVNDPKGEKVEIDANSQYFGTAEEYQNFKFRLKTNGKSSSNNSLSLTVPSEGTLKIYARSGSGSEARPIVLTQDGTEIFNQNFDDADAITTDIQGEQKKVFPVYTVEVKAGTIAITYPTNTVGFYAFELVKAGEETAIKNVSTTANDKMFDLNGRQIKSVPATGVYVKGGKKYIVK